MLVANLSASARWLSLLSARLAEQTEPEAAGLVEQARADLDAVCTRLSDDRQQGLPHTD